MKLILAFVTTFAVLILALYISETGDGSGTAYAGETISGTPTESATPTAEPSQTVDPTQTRAPRGEPICDEDVPDEGDDDDDPEDEDDDGDSDDPSDRNDSGGVGPQGPGSSTPAATRDPWDGFDHDDELDDCYGPRSPCLTGMTTPGAYLFSGTDYTGICYFYGSDTIFTGFVPPDFANDNFASMKLAGFPQVTLCEHSLYDGLCVPFTGNDPDLSDNGLFFPGHPSNVSSLFFGTGSTGSPTPTPDPDPNAVHVSDANCDGDVDGNDALAALSFSAGSGAGCTGINSGMGLAGDADCSGSVNTADATHILLVVAALASPDC